MRRTWRKWSGHHSLRGHCESRIASRLDVATKEAAAEAAEAAVSINTVNYFSHNFIGDSLGLIPSIRDRVHRNENFVEINPV